MHTLDIFFVIAGIFFIVVGIRRGLIGELFRLVALIAGFIVAFLYYTEVSKLFHFRPPYIANSLSFTLIFIITALAIIGTGWLIKKIVHLTPLGWVDFFFGGAIGLVKCALIFWVVCLSLAAVPQSKFILGLQRSMVFQTYKKLPPVIQRAGITKIRSMIKRDIEEEVPQKLRNVKNQLEQLDKTADSAAPPPRLKYR
jgi:uncharacterized membrane protein required for colicin V production